MLNVQNNRAVTLLVLIPPRFFFRVVAFMGFGFVGFLLLFGFCFCLKRAGSNYGRSKNGIELVFPRQPALHGAYSLHGDSKIPNL